ncbi:MAG: hypothetical protein D6815_01230 [Candidatus Dadabacteria bacterium]|nr:MAG: hypothetical protein D6815_01230 [Candidatus Dadabacteria bacterium]
MREKEAAMRYLNNSEYESFLLSVLKKTGLTADDALRLLAARWPMPAVPGLGNEAFGRGLIVSHEDVADWLREVIGETWDNGEPVEPTTTLVSPRLADSFFAWAVANGRAKSTPVGQMMSRNPERLDMILKASKAHEN